MINNLGGNINEEDSKLVDSILNDLNMVEQSGKQVAPAQQGQPEITQEQKEEMIMRQKQIMAQQEMLQQNQQMQQDAAFKQQMSQLYEPYQRTGFVSDIFQGSPTSASSITMSTAPGTNPLAQAVGAGITGLAAYQGFAKK